MEKALKLGDKLCDKREIWYALSGKIIKNSTVILSFGDIWPSKKGPIFHADTIFLDNCDKNFIYYWLDKNTFPFAKTIYLSSHPCEHDVLERDFDRIILSSNNADYKRKWAKNNDNVSVLDKKEIDDMIESYETEDLEFFDDSDE